MKHIVILDDRTKRNKAFLELAKDLSDVKILTAAQWEAMEDEFMAHEIKKGLKTASVDKKAVIKALQKMRA